MNEPGKTGLETIFEDLVRRVVHEELNGNGHGDGYVLLTAEQLAARLNVPKSWVEAQSRQGKIPTRRLGHYIRFDLQEVLEVTAPRKKSGETP
jgi:excisionase family DNA binding protein